MIQDIKLQENETVRDNELPESVSWESVVERPQSVMDLSPTDGIKLESIDSDGRFINDIINDNLNTQTARILGEFQFQDSGALAMKTDSNNGLWLSPTGILAKDGGTTTFAIDTGGNATFRGSITASTITGGSITGATIKTASSGSRVEMSGANNRLDIYSGSTRRMSLDGDSLEFYNSSGTKTAVMSAESGFALVIDGSGSSFATVLRYNTTYGMYIQTGGGANVAQFYNGGMTMLNGAVIRSYDIEALNTSASCGTSSKPWGYVRSAEVVTSGGITLGGVRRTTWPSTSSGANTSLSNLSGVSVNTTINMNGNDITNCGYLEMDGEIAMGSYDINCTAAIQLAGGGYIDDARAIYFETGRTSNPNISGEMRYYDGASKGFRCNVDGTLYQFSLFEP